MTDEEFILPLEDPPEPEPETENVVFEARPGRYVVQGRQAHGFQMIWEDYEAYDSLALAQEQAKARASRDCVMYRVVDRGE